ncbi:MAG: alpha,alpha-trehalose-phosphate synthase (UDP-forming) [Candidatus Polarisedimenticolia bacterium]
MSRLVVVSNRLPIRRSAEELAGFEISAGGLATAVMGALQRTPGSIWFGWSGHIVDPDRASRMSRSSIQGIDLVGLPLTAAEMEEYYLGFCNQALWPMFHCFQGRVRIRARHLQRYESVQTRFARALLPLLRPGDLVWVHDYHLIPFGRELRSLGWRGRIGFFLHIPFPPYELWEILPDPRRFLQALLAYDLVGFHVQRYLQNYIRCLREEMGAAWDGATVSAEGISRRAGAYPVGIEPRDFLPSASASGPAPARRVDRRRTTPRRLVLAVDRLDYSKGIPERLRAFEMLLKRYPQWQTKVSLLQVASPSRTGVPEYEDQKKRIEALMGRINGELGEHDWAPIRYLYRSYPRDFLARLYRQAEVGLVTPLRDGMNLVSKEYVASQDPASPGVLVLSRCAGSADQLREAVIVNPYVPSDVARGIDMALTMPLEERRERHASLLRSVTTETAGEWGRRFLADLESTPGGTPEAQPDRAILSPSGLLS